jgi:hypothetical protein
VFLFDLNLPRVAAALVAGGCLGIAGALFQSLTRNPLAGPEVLGVTQDAGLITLFALSTWPLMGHVTLAAAALIGGGLSLAITLALNHRHRYAPLAVALTGIVIGAPYLLGLLILDERRARCTGVAGRCSTFRACWCGFHAEWNGNRHSCTAKRSSRTGAHDASILPAKRRAARHSGAGGRRL